MGKLRLDLDRLHVETFATDERARERGTVQGNAELDGMQPVDIPAGTFKQTCMIDFCADSWMSGCLTCAGTCVNTCQASCKTCNTCFGAETCFGGMTCMTGCLGTCPSGGEICCA